MVRNMLRQKLYATITLLGLTAGISFSLVIGVFVWSELKVNQNLKDVDRLYLVESVATQGESNMPSFFVPAILGQRAVEKYPTFFENFYRFRDRSITVSRHDKHLRIQSMIGDSTLFSMFGFQVLAGSEEKALQNSGLIVITEKIARQFFNRLDVVGESLTVSTENNGLQPYVISAVIADLQDKNSVSDFMNMDAQVFLSQQNRANFNLGGIDDWSASIITYIKITRSATKEDATLALNKIFATEAPADVQKNRTISLSAISDYYLITNGAAVQKLIISLAVIGAFIIFLAIANFININVARSFSRLKEVGVRSVIGGLRKQFMTQFLGEAMFIAMSSTALSLIFYEFLHHFVGNLLDMALPSVWDFDFQIWVGLLGAALLIGIVAGIYPAVYLSTAKITDSLKGKFKSVKGTIQFSQALVTVQFVVALFIFTASLIMSKQIIYLLETDSGYDKSRVLIVSSVPRLWDDGGFSKMDAAKSSFLSSPSIQAVSLSWGAPNFNFSPYSAHVNKVGLPLKDGILTVMQAADEDYARVYGLRVLEGNFFFNSGEAQRSDYIVVNEAAREALGIEVGHKVSIEFSEKEFTVAGIVKDFNYESFHKPIQPVVFVHTREFQAFRFFSFKLAGGNVSKAVSEIESVWKNVFPNDPFVYNFADDRLATIYKTELQLRQASIIGSALILIIVLTGVLGLVSLNLAKRNKEIGIRKVLGARVVDILFLMSREYTFTLTISFILGMPLSFWFCQQWLNGFAYRMGMQWWLFAIPVAVIFGTTILLVVAQSLKTSLSNPVKSLRYE